ncbi:MAG: hypothetical protein COA38_05470 [Fluviicola sp.]|nr:MAG: hypothetical protein COA38_05470 [Fluviicola sp.]
MITNPFYILGTWKLTSEESEELLQFLGDGSYRIYYRNPFRMIELGNWLIRDESLVMCISNVELSSSITRLENDVLSLKHKDENEKIVHDSFRKVE